MKTEDIAKLPPELQRAAELCEKLETLPWHNHDGIGELMRCQKCVDRQSAWEQLIAESRTALPKALTYCLQMQEERDQYLAASQKNVEFLAEEMVKTIAAQATIVTLTRELEKAQEMIAILWKNGKFGMSCGNALSEDGVLRKAIAAHKERTSAALSHTPEGGK